MPAFVLPQSPPARWKASFVGALVLVATIVCSAVLHYRAMHALQIEVQD